MGVITVVNKHSHTAMYNDDVYIGRGSPLGNPYTSKSVEKTKATYQADSREDAINKYEEYLRKKIEEKDEAVCDELNRIYRKAVAGNVNLVCFCKPHDCHGDIIKKVIDEKLPKA